MNIKYKNRTENYFNMKVLIKPTTATMLALAIIMLSANLNVVNGQFSRNDYRSGFLVTNPCVSKQTCSECLQTPTCAWCMKEVRIRVLSHQLHF